MIEGWREKNGPRTREPMPLLSPVSSLVLTQLGFTVRALPRAGALRRLLRRVARSRSVGGGRARLPAGTGAARKRRLWPTGQWEGAPTKAGRLGTEIFPRLCAQVALQRPWEPRAHTCRFERSHRDPSAISGLLGGGGEALPAGTRLITAPGAPPRGTPLPGGRGSAPAAGLQPLILAEPMGSPDLIIKRPCMRWIHRWLASDCCESRMQMEMPLSI